MSRQRLGLVLTGGTIGSTVAGDVAVVQLQPPAPSSPLPSWLAGPLAAFGAHQLEVCQPVAIHSEEARPADWTAIAAACRQLADRGAEAICVLHGSDTMGYTAAALSFALADLPVPVVLTGSNLPPDAVGSDAQHNVRGALLALRTLPAGVYLAFAGDPHGEVLVHAGSRVRKFRASGVAFESPNGGPLAVVRDDRLRRRLPWPLPEPVAAGTTVDAFRASVLALQVHPGMPFAALEAAVVAGGLDGVVAELYPCATGPTGDDEASLTRFARFVSARGGVTVATVAVAPEDPAAEYPSLPALRDAGVGYLPGMITATATVKLMWALAQTDGDAGATRRLMQRSIAGEHATIGMPSGS